MVKIDSFEYFAALARVLKAAGISTHDADLYYWRPGAWPGLGDRWPEDRAVLLHRLGLMTIDLVDQRLGGRPRSPDQDAALREMAAITYDYATDRLLEIQLSGRMVEHAAELRALSWMLGMSPDYDPMEIADE